MKYEYKEKPYDETDPKSIEEYAKKLVGHTFKELSEWQIPHSVREEIEEYGKKARKGGLGNMIEEKYFGYKANSDPKPDFPKAGVELKVTPYEIKKNNKLSAGERLVLTMISYESAIEPDFFKSHLWNKCKLILLIFYLRDRKKASNLDYAIDFVKLFSPPEQDLKIITEDYNYIIEKIAAGKANELSEADTMYLGACTKGATAEKSTVPQFYYAPDVKARKRAFCFKTSYMSYILNNYIVQGKDTYESIIKDPKELNENSFEQIIKTRIERYVGKTDSELCEIFGREYNNNKAQWSDLAFKMLGIKSNKAEEFAKAQIVVKAIRIEATGKITENSPLPTFSFKKLINEEWEESELFKYFNETRFLFVVYKKVAVHYVLKGCQMWNMPYSDLADIVHPGWEAIRDTIINGVELTKVKQKNGYRIDNNFPKKGDNPIIHIRPHAQQAYYVFEDGSSYGAGRLSDSDVLPDGRRMTKQSFWLNNDYLLSQLKPELMR